MKKLKQLFLIIVMGVIVMNSVGCAGTPKSQKKLAKQILEEKYNESFEIKELRGTHFYDGYYLAIAYPTERPEVLFQVSVDLDGKEEADNYISKLLCLKLSDTIAKNLDGLKGFYYLFTEPMVENSLLTDPNLTIDEYMQKWPNSEFTIYLNYCPDNEGNTVDMDALYNELIHAFDGLESMSGCICLYLVDEDTMADMQEYRQTHDKCYSDYDERAERYYVGKIEFEKGRLTTSKEEMIKMMENR